MKNKILMLCACLIGFILLSSSSCDSTVVKQESNSGAKQIGSFFKIPLNSNGLTGEQQNIYDRLYVTTDPTKILWIHLIALDGKIIRRMPVVCKVTSSGKRLEPTHCSGTYSTNSEGNYYPKAGISNFETDEFIGADGTFGSSDSYIYWFDVVHRYHQWGTAGGLGYLLTDYPIDIDNPIDKITGLYSINKASYEWQKDREADLVKKEGPAYEKWKTQMENQLKDLKEMNKQMQDSIAKQNKK